jgi:hypothetical protein
LVSLRKDSRAKSTSVKSVDLRESVGFSEI